MVELRQIVYVSRAAEPLSAAALRRLLADAGRKNWRLNVTGCLLYTGRSFVQVLEGGAQVVGGLVDRIAQHPWHSGLRTLLDRPIEQRRYGNWSMGYVYSLDLADRIEALLSGAPPEPQAAVELLEQLRPDPVMGPL